MKILNVSEEDFATSVHVVSGEKEETFYVQLTDNKYRSDLGCWITTDVCGDDIDPDKYPDFDIDAVVEAAEEYAKKAFLDRYTEEVIDFRCALDSNEVYMRIDNETEEVQLVIKDTGHVGDYQRRYKETDYIFGSKKEAEEYANQFRTGEHQDCSGLYHFMQTIQAGGEL